MYIELHCHSAFSFLDGTAQPGQLALAAKGLGYPALALTDNNGLYGSMIFAQAARQIELQPITGADVTLLDGSHVTLLAETPTGYANLSRLITEAHLGTEDRHDPRLDFASLEAQHEGIIILSGCRRGLLPTVLEREGPRAAQRFADRCRAVFGTRNFFVELQRNEALGDRYRTRLLGELADAVGLSVVATGDVHYHRESGHRLHDALVSIKHRTTLDGSHDERKPNSDFYLKSPKAVAERFHDRPDALANTIAIAERCASFDLTQDLGYTFPNLRGTDQIGRAHV